MTENKSFNDFLDKHTGVLTLLGLFMIFLGTASNQIFPKIQGVIDFSSGSSFIWLSFMLIVIMCFITLIRSSWSYSTISTKFFGSFLLIAFIPLIFYFLISVFLNKDIVGAVSIFPRSIFIAVLVMAPLFVIVGINSIGNKIIRRILHAILFFGSLVLLIDMGSIKNISDGLSSLDYSTWLFISVIISYIFSLSFFVKDTTKKKN